MSNLKVGTIGAKITVDCSIDITVATVRKIIYKKPDGTSGEWTAAEESSTSISYTTDSADDLDQAGTWYFESYVEKAGFTGYGTRTSSTIDPHIKT